MDDKPVVEIEVKEEVEITPEAVPSEELTHARTELEKATARATVAEKQLAEIQARELTAGLKAEAESFKALGLVVDEYVEKMTAIRRLNPELAGWVKDRFTAVDTAMVAAGVLTEIGSEQEADLEGDGAFYRATERILQDKFNGDMAKWPEAISLATKEYPKLAAAYAAG